ncbi:MAG: hypothetical protein CMH53_05410 [Myxococcales bacterium]|nr:hypothetical protein [Myxococcales bacterium]
MSKPPSKTNRKRRRSNRRGARMVSGVKNAASMPNQQLPSYHLFTTLDRVNKLMTRKIGEIARAHNATSTQLMVVATLARHPDGLKSKDLSAALAIRPGSLTGTLDTLQDRGYIARVRVAGDGRQQRIVLLTKAEELIEALAEAERTLSQTFSACSSQNLGGLSDALCQVENNLLGKPNSKPSPPANQSRDPQQSSTRDRVISLSSRVLSAVDAVRRLRDE